MKFRVRFSLQGLMVAVALLGVFLTWAIDRSRRGYPLVVFDSYRYVQDEPLKSPARLLAIKEDGNFLLEDGREIRLEPSAHRHQMRDRG